MSGIPQSVLMASHDSRVACDWCGALFLPRIRRGPNKDRFCQPSHKDAWWNLRKKGTPPATKISRILSILASGRSLNRYEAEKAARDHTLNSTIAEIQNRLEIPVVRNFEIVPGFRGQVRRYWLEGEAIERARRYLEQRHE